VLVRNLTLSGVRSEHTVRVSTIYQFMTVFNHSDHAITVFPENLTDEREKHYRVPPRIYLTLPLFGAGKVESCQREVVYTAVSEGVSIPSTVIGLTFTEENNNINMPFPDMSAPTPTPISVIFPVQSKPYQVALTPQPIQVALAPTLLRQVMPLIPRRGTIPISGSVTFITPSAHVRRYSIFIQLARAGTLTIRERIDTIEGEGVFFHVASIPVPGGAHAPFIHTGELSGNMIEVVLLNGAVDTSIYDISMIGHVT